MSGLGLGLELGSWRWIYVLIPGESRQAWGKAARLPAGRARVTEHLTSCVCVCMYVYVSERERENEGLPLWAALGYLFL